MKYLHFQKGNVLLTVIFYVNEYTPLNLHIFNLKFSSALLENYMQCFLVKI